jgi:hypothetical protein
MQEVHAEEDAAHARLVANWRYEIEQADENGDQDLRATAQQALARAEHQRQRQLSNRQYPDQPPF